MNFPGGNLLINDLAKNIFFKFQADNSQTMGRTVIVLYRPKQGKEKQLLQVIKDHLPILRAENLATEKKPVVMRAADGTVVEVFEWKSVEAIRQAHSNQVVGKLWEQFAEVCDFEIPVNIKEFQNLFSEFETIE